MSFIIGVDIGGTFIKGGVVTQRGEILYSSKVATPSSRDFSEVCACITAFVDEALLQTKLQKEQVVGIGVACPGAIDTQNGIVVDSSNLKWYNQPLKSVLERACSLPVRIVNDADAATVAEMQFGAGKGYQDAVMLTLGTGIGSGVYKHGVLVDGVELGHMAVVPNGRKCACGRHGCFEKYCSASALVYDTKRAVQNKDTRMKSEKTITGETVFLYAKKDTVAKEILQKYFVRFVCGALNCANVFLPQAIILGGGICASLKAFLPELKERINRESSFPVELLIAEQENNAGLLGAGALWLERGGLV